MLGLETKSIDTDELTSALDEAIELSFREELSVERKSDNYFSHHGLSC